MPWADRFHEELIELFAEAATPRRRGTPSDDAEQRLVDARARKLAKQRAYESSPEGLSKQRERQRRKRAENIAAGLTWDGQARQRPANDRGLSEEELHRRELARNRRRRETFWVTLTEAERKQVRKLEAARLRMRRRRRIEAHRKRDREYHREWRARRAAA